jgi:VWFA-related protein
MRALIMAVALLTQAASAQSPPADPPAAAEQTISVNASLVNMLFTVSNRRGRFVTSLPKDKFRVYEDNKIQSITQFSKETDLPLTIAILIDTSGSIGDKLPFERQAAIEFLRSTLRRAKDKALLITFDTGIDLIQDYTDDVGALARAAEKIRAGGSTAMYDAIHLAATEKLSTQTGRHIEILISDGNDTSSRKSLDEALRSARQSDTAIYCISTNSILRNSSRDTASGTKVLRRFAEETGGRIFMPRTTDELASTFKEIDEELRSQYALAYHPNSTRRDGAFHTIRIETSDKELQVKARNGYFDAPHF